MARSKQVETAALPSGEVEVRALVDRSDLGFAAGRLARVQTSELPGLKAANMVDDSAEAVAYAHSLEPAP